MSDDSGDERLRRLFHDAAPGIADDGFARDVMHRIERIRRRRRVVLGAAMAAGAAIAGPALLHGLGALAGSAAWTQLVALEATPVAALCACVAALWLVSVGAEE